MSSDAGLAFLSRSEYCGSAKKGGHRKTRTHSAQGINYAIHDWRHVPPRTAYGALGRFDSILDLLFRFISSGHTAPRRFTVLRCSPGSPRLLFFRSFLGHICSRIVGKCYGM